MKDTAASKPTKPVAVVETFPRASRRVDLVGLVVCVMLQMRTVLVNEIPNHGLDIGLGPFEPVLGRGLHVEDRPAVKLRRVHLTYVIW